MYCLYCLRSARGLVWVWGVGTNKDPCVVCAQLGIMLLLWREKTRVTREDCVLRVMTVCDVYFV